VSKLGGGVTVLFTSEGEKGDMHGMPGTVT
jgi:hypothetical protein